MKSMARITGDITLPSIDGELSMIPFDCQTFSGLNDEMKEIAKQMMRGIHAVGTAYFTIHGKILKKSETLRRPGAHTDGNYEPSTMSWGGWKIGQDGPAINTDAHKRLYLSENGGMILATNFVSSVAFIGEIDGIPHVGGDCTHLDLPEPTPILAGKVWYGNNHFVHESLPVSEDVHRVIARITLPSDHVYQS